MLACAILFRGLANALTVQYAYQVNFTDKNGTPFSLSSPIAYLSPRAIARRTTQGIAIDSTDLPVNQAYIDSVLKLTGGVLHEASKWQNLCVILDTDTVSIHALAGKAFIKSVKQIGYYPYILHNKIAETTDNATVNPSKNLKVTDDASYYNLAWGQTQLINGNYLNDLGYKGAGKLIAVLDAGFVGVDTSAGFDSLRNSGRLIDVHNFSYGGSNVYMQDDHGTDVLSTMATYDPGTYVGSAPLAMYALYITEKEPDEQPVELVNLLCGIERADSVGADVLTCSLGYNQFDSSKYDFTFATDLDGKTTTAARAVNMATSKGMLFIASAGNEGGDSWNMLLTPGDADSAITVGNVYDNAIISIVGSSGFGPNAAGQVKPDVCAVGQPAEVHNEFGYTPASGTSFSTPQIAGWATCLWEGNPTASPYQIRTAIQQCASNYSTPAPHYGYGLANFKCAAQLLNVKDTPSPGQSDKWVTSMPNPFAENLEIILTLPTTGNVTLQLIDITGKAWVAYTKNFAAGINLPEYISTKYLPAGTYFLRAIAPTIQKTLKVVKS